MHCNKTPTLENLEAWSQLREFMTLEFWVHILFLCQFSQLLSITDVLHIMNFLGFDVRLRLYFYLYVLWSLYLSFLLTNPLLKVLNCKKYIHISFSVLYRDVFPWANTAAERKSPSGNTHSHWSNFGCVSSQGTLLGLDFWDAFVCLLEEIHSHSCIFPIKTTG